MHPFTLVENLKVAEGLPPAADAAGRSSDVVSLKNVHKLIVVAHITQGNAATVALTPEQCTAVSGAGNKAIPAVPIWANLDTAASDSLVRAADAVSYTTDAALKNKIVVFEIDASKLDVAGGFDCIRVNTGASNAANITQIMFYAVPRYPGDGGPSIIVD
jgi:hypothetical protein